LSLADVGPKSLSEGGNQRARFGTVSKRYPGECLLLREAAVHRLQILCACWPCPDQGRGSPAPAQAGAESWSCPPTSLGRCVLSLALGAPAPRAARAFPMPAWDPLTPTVLASELSKPLLSWFYPLLLPEEPPTIGLMV